MTPDNIDTEALREKYVESLAKLPPWKCGRIDMNTFLPEPVQVGRVCSDVIRYVYFDDGQEVVVIGVRADEIAFAASEYRALLATIEAQRKEIDEAGSNYARAERELSNTVEECRVLFSERDALKAEVATLSDLVRQGNLNLSASEAEVERLRAALTPNTTEQRRPFKSGDIVSHRPTGEKWLLIRDEHNGYVHPGGWPPTEAKASDCELVLTAEQAYEIRGPSGGNS